MDGKKKYCSTQLNLTEPLRKQVQEWIDSHIAPEMLAPEEINGPDLHVTVKYGLHDDNPEAIRDLVKGFGPVQIYYGEISVFDTDPNYDVLKLDVVASPDLFRLNKLVVDNLAHTDTFPGYKPHTTLAYLKKGYYELFFGGLEFYGCGFIALKLNFSNTEKHHTVISLD